MKTPSHVVNTTTPSAQSSEQPISQSNRSPRYRVQFIDSLDFVTDDSGIVQDISLHDAEHLAQAMIEHGANVRIVEIGINTERRIAPVDNPSFPAQQGSGVVCG